MSFLPLQNVSKGEINRFHIALYFLTHALFLPSQALPYFLLSDWARSHFYPFPSGLGNQSTQTIGAIVATLYTTHSYLSLSCTKTGPTPCKSQSKVRTIERTGTQYLNKFSTSVVFKPVWRHERHVVSVGTSYKTNFI